MQESNCQTPSSQQALKRCSQWVQDQQEKSVSIESEQQDGPADSTNFIIPDINPPSEHSMDGDFSEATDVPHFYDQSDRSQVLHQDDTEMDTSVFSDKSFVPQKKLWIHNSTIVLHCGWRNCEFESSSVPDFVSHVSSHLPSIEMRVEDDEDVYACLWDSCDFVTPNADEVTRHVNFHSYHTKLKCIGNEICNFRKLPPCNYPSSGANLVPDLPHIFECHWYTCTQTFNNCNSFFTHVQSHVFSVPHVTSSKLKNKVCEWKGCKMKVRNLVKLEEHVRKHTQEKSAACPTCGGLFANRTKLVDHRKRQIALELHSYQCSHCSRYYSSERLLRDHMRHHVNYYKCEFCDMTCQTPYLLSAHIRYRHLDIKAFSCQYCPHRCKRERDLKIHLQVHVEDSEFVCEENGCDFSCRTFYALGVHYRKVHGDGNPPLYCCHMCDSRFRRGANLTEHLMKKHNFRWPSGHPRFRYKRHEDGLYRLQTYRYESLEVAEGINSSTGIVKSVDLDDDGGKFHVSVKSSTDKDVAAKVLISEGEPIDPDDPEAASPKTPKENSCGLSMPSLDEETVPPSSKLVLISIEEVDELGNILHSETLETEELINLDCVDEMEVVADGNETQILS